MSDKGIYCCHCAYLRARRLLSSAIAALLCLFMAAIIVIVSLSQGVKPDEEVLPRSGVIRPAYNP